MLSGGLTAEDLDRETVIVNKLRWFVLAKRRKDFEDARNVISVHHAALDWVDIRQWCATLDLEAALAEAERVVR